MTPGSGVTLGGYDPEGLPGYRLKSTSTLRGVGISTISLDIDPGKSDFFGHAIPHTAGSGFNVGADGSP